MINVLIIDDEQVSQEFIRALVPWNSLGFELLPPAYSATSARMLLKDFNVHVILLDMYMPEEDGITFHEYLMYEYPSIHVLAISSHDDYDYVRKVLKYGAHDYILKSRLSRSILTESLKSIKAKIEGYEGRNGYADRSIIHDWLLLNKPYPSFLEGKKVAISILRILPISNELSKNINQVVPQLLDLIDKSYSNMNISEVKVTSIFHQPAYIIVIYSFNKSIENVEIERYIFLENERIKKDFEQYYGINIMTGTYPLMAKKQNFPVYVQTRLKQLHFNPVEDDFKEVVLLSLALKKELITAIEQCELISLRSIIETTFNSIDENDIGIILNISKDFLEILFQARDEIFLQSDESIYVLLEQIAAMNLSEIKDFIFNMFVSVIDSMQCNSNPKRALSSITRIATQYIQEHFHESISLEYVADILDVSPSHLSRTFKIELGKNFTDFLNEVRVTNAKTYLLLGKPIKEVALLCGYNHPTYFVKVFKKYTNLTPSEFSNKI